MKPADERDWTDSDWPTSVGSQRIPYSVTDDVIRVLYRSKQIDEDFELTELGSEWFLGTFSIDKHEACFRIGWTYPLQPASRLYGRWFELADLGLSGWAIIFRITDPIGEPTGTYEIFVGWVPAARRADADRWIDFLNSEIRNRLVKAGKSPR
jgi:hypothetical protein